VWWSWSSADHAMRSSASELPWIRRDVNCVFPESIERDDLESSLMGGRKDDVRCRAVHVRL
jgi:hypothetical protein